jgi:transcriptional regulator with XRE-family HTH domain
MARRRRSKEDAASFEGMGRAVIELRNTRRLTQAELASRAEIGLTTLRQIEQGQDDAKWGTLRRLGSALDIPLDVMIEMAEELALGIDRAARREQGQRG